MRPSSSVPPRRFARSTSVPKSKNKQKTGTSGTATAIVAATPTVVAGAAPGATPPAQDSSACESIDKQKSCFADKKLKIYQDLFDEVISRDSAFGPLLTKIKIAYEGLLSTSHKGKADEARKRVAELDDDTKSCEKKCADIRDKVKLTYEKRRMLDMQIQIANQTEQQMES
mmetsp:Transcript_4300/g.10495  ORF Transcript_4300/g.10495 Transcript_4300/m.10495 type:complete len:171 (+) Transcript_4300:86-598(+)|eukprot:g13131.t1